MLFWNVNLYVGVKITLEKNQHTQPNYKTFRQYKYVYVIYYFINWFFIVLFIPNKVLFFIFYIYFFAKTKICSWFNIYIYIYIIFILYTK